MFFKKVTFILLVLLTLMALYCMHLMKVNIANNCFPVNQDVQDFKPEMNRVLVNDGFVRNEIAPDKEKDLPPVSLNIPSVHFVWCKQSYFRFNHYLSVRSIYQILRPNKIVMHFDEMPVVDKHMYNQWFTYLQSEIMMLVTKKLPKTFECSKKMDVNYIKSALKTAGSVYFPVFAVVGNLKFLSDLSFEKWIDNCTTGEADTNTVLVKLRRSEQKRKSEICVNDLKDDQFIRTSCLSEELYNKQDGAASFCVYLQRELNPRDIWNMNTSFGALSRLVIYGKAEIPRPLYSSENRAPRISHFVWLRDRSLSFFEHLTILSAVYVAGFRKVFIHGVAEPKGKWWKVLQKHENIIFIPTESSSTVFNQQVSKFVQHQSDVIRLEILRKHGGFYEDFDIMWVNKIPADYFNYDMMMSFDWTIVPLWPEKFNNGVIMSKKNGKFLRMYIDSMKKYVDENWGFNSLMMPYRIYEMHPETIFANRHLSVICYQAYCHPSWAKKYQGGISMKRGSSFDWRNETLALHFTGSKPYGDTLESLKRHSLIIYETAANVLKVVRERNRTPVQ